MDLDDFHLFIDLILAKFSGSAHSVDPENDGVGRLRNPPILNIPPRGSPRRDNFSTPYTILTYSDQIWQGNTFRITEQSLGKGP